MTIGNEYLKSIIARLKSYKELGDKTFVQLDKKDFHFLASSESNSISILVHHISGNMLSRFTNFLTEDGEKEWRDRDDEFETHINNKEQIIAQWEKGWKCLLNTLSNLEEKDLLTTVFVRKEPLSALDAINRQLAHYASHIGQIIFIAKMAKNQNWKTLSIPKGHSQQFNQSNEPKDPAKKF